MKQFPLLLLTTVLMNGFFIPQVHATSDITERVKGYVLLQVEEHGEAWYVNPANGLRYYMQDGTAAYEMMRSFGLGISETDFARLDAGAGDLVGRLKGKIVLRVQLHGEAYYVHPVTGELYYLKNGDAAYSVMRYQSLGITNRDLLYVPVGTLTTSNSQPPTTVAGTSTNTPSNIDLTALNVYWRDEINALRADAGVRELVIDERFVKTATEWATWMGENDTFTHTRPDGSSMHTWINTKNLDFTERYEPGGWTTNYFSENIAWGYTGNSMDGVKKMLDNSLQMMLAEGPTGGHYRTIYHPDWNSVGVGFSFDPVGDGRYKVFVAMHYGSLE